jgi:hypothetical protein
MSTVCGVDQEDGQPDAYLRRIIVSPHRSWWRALLVTLAPAAGGGVNFTGRDGVTYGNFGDPVTVPVPPASRGRPLQRQLR